jgi:hypothetical protein
MFIPQGMYTITTNDMLGTHHLFRALLDIVSWAKKTNGCCLLLQKHLEEATFISLAQCISGV